MFREDIKMSQSINDGNDLIGENQDDGETKVVMRRKKKNQNQDFEKRRSFRRSLTESDVFMNFVSTTDITEFFSDEKEGAEPQVDDHKAEQIRSPKGSTNNNFKWCIECSVLSTDDLHDDHAICAINLDVEETILALDEMVEFGCQSLTDMEQELVRQRKILDEIKWKRDRFLRMYRKRVDRVMRDVKNALEDQGAVIFNQMEADAIVAQQLLEESLLKAPPKLDSAREFLKKGAMLIPENDGNVEQEQLKKIKTLYDTLSVRMPQMFVDVGEAKFKEVQFQNSYLTKLACKNLAKDVMGWIQSNDAKQTTI